ncbi:MAG: SusC/RagA family TonB-linked outer membrane protein [Runella zeae]
MKKNLLLLMGIVLCIAQSYAQNRTVTGKVTAAADGSPLPGVNVLVKGSNTGSSTNAEGTYQIQVPNNATLVFSFIGYLSQEIAVGSQTSINVSLSDDVKQLSEVVVTAVGIERSNKTLGYSVERLSAEKLVQKSEPDVIKAMQGKIPGVNINGSGGAAGSSSRITIRGANSFFGSNQPLFVVDGVPIDNGNYGSGTGVDYGNGAASINPDDIENVSVLKGPSAAALYGSRGANGVILITTKSGKGSKGIGVSFNSNTAFDTPFRLPEWQDGYGQGNKGRFSFVDGTGKGVNDGVDESWGPKMDGQLIPQFDSPIAADGTRTPTPFIPHPDNVSNFFETGKTYTNNIAITGANEKGDFRLSYTDLNQSGILPNTDYKRRTLSLNAGWNVTKKLSIRATGNYVVDGSDNRTNWGLYFIWFGRQVDMEKLKDYQAPGSIYQYNWNYNYWTNPYYVLNLSTKFNQRDRVYGNVAATYKFTDWLTLTARTGTDVYIDRRKTKNAARIDNLNGAKQYDSYNEEQIFIRESNSDFLLTATHKFGEFDVAANLGANHRSNYYQRNYMGATELAIPRVWNLGNSRQAKVAENSFTEKVVNSVYAAANIGFRNYLFLDLTARNDWSSALPSDNRSYFYPSAALSAVLTDMLGINSPVLSFAKVRAGIARVGNDTDAYRLIQAYKYENPWGSTPSLSENNAMLNANLKPELTNSYEIGAEVKLWRNRVGLDVTYYNKQSFNQILDVNISQSTGFTSKLLNAGKLENKGVEIQLSATPVIAGPFQWDVAVNWARNQNKVIELAEGLTTYTLGTVRGMAIEARVGQPYGNFFGQGFARDPNGNIIYDKSGYPTLNPTRRILGNFTPKWIGGLQNTFTYKRLSLSTLIDMKKGGDIFSQSVNIGRYTGVLKETLMGREEGIVGEGVVNTGTATEPVYVPNTTRITSEEWHHKYYALTNNEMTIFDGSFVKLREVKLTYMISGQVFRKLPFRDIAISVVGRNLLLLHSNVPHIDPETSFYNDGNLQGIENGQIPTTRTMGFNISFNL